MRNKIGDARAITSDRLQRRRYIALQRMGALKSQLTPENLERADLDPGIGRADAKE